MLFHGCGPLRKCRYSLPDLFYIMAFGINRQDHLQLEATGSAPHTPALLPQRATDSALYTPALPPQVSGYPNLDTQSRRLGSGGSPTPTL